MWPFVAIILGLYAIYKYVGVPNSGLIPIGGPGVAPPTPGAMLVAPLMSHGAYYQFTVRSTLDPAALAEAFGTVGALIEQPGALPAGVGVWSGILQWQGADGEPTEHLDGVEWVSLTPAPPEYIPPPANMAMHAPGLLPHGVMGMVPTGPTPEIAQVSAHVAGNQLNPPSRPSDVNYGGDWDPKRHREALRRSFDDGSR